MTESNASSPPTRRRHIVRLVLFVAFLLGLFYLFAVARVVDVDDVRSAVAATGPFAPLTYIVLSATLGALLVPGPILAAGSGVLFGPLLGTFVTLGFGGRNRRHHQPHRQAGGPRKCTRAARNPACRSNRRAARTRRIVGGGGPTLHPRGVRRPSLVRVRRVRSSAVADGRRCVHRRCAARIRLYRARRVDRESVGAAGVQRHRGVVRDRHHRGGRREARIPPLARPRSALGSRTRRLTTPLARGVAPEPGRRAWHR
jgi:hypothetical protein